MKRIILIALVGWVGLVGQARAQAALTADTIALGDQATLTLPLRGEGMPPLELGKVEVVGQQFDTATGVMQATVTCFEPGEHWLKVGDDSLRLVVTDVEVDTTTAEIRDIAPVEKVPYTFWEVFRWVLLAWAVAAVAVVVWYLMRRRKRCGSIFAHQEPVDTRNPYERATEALEALRESRLWQAGKAKEYHTELTDIVRRFIEEATGIRATDMTSEETVEAVRSAECGVRSAELMLPHPDNSELRTPSSELYTIFTIADLVKFAKGEPLPHEHEASLKAASEFVDSLWALTQPKGEEKEEMRKRR